MAKTTSANKHTKRNPATKEAKARKTKQLNYDKRYGESQAYRVRCAKTHQATHGLCCLCLVRSSTEIHHGYYSKKDKIGISIFAVCSRCHIPVCHSPLNWVIHPKNPVWKNRNTPEFLEKLQHGFKLLSGGS